MMNLVSFLTSIGAHLGGWRHRDAWTNTTMNWDQALACARIAERGKFDLLFLADGNGVRDMDSPDLFAALTPTARPAGFEPLTLLSAISTVTERIGLVATATTTFDQPYLLARRFASLDHLSRGRAGWNVVTSSDEKDALNFSLDQHVEKEARYERAHEFVDVVFGLWDSWARDAFPQDQQTGRFLKPERVHVLDHAGKYFKVKGPLNMPRPPQGRPVIFHAGQSEAGRNLAAYAADCVFAVADNKASAQAFYADMKRRAVAQGRSTDSLRILPGASVFVGRTAAEADELYDELKALISPVLGVHYLSKMVATDLSRHPVDGLMPEVQGDVIGIASIRVVINEMAQKERLTVRQTYERILPSMGHVLFKGDAMQVADQMEEWYRGQACDGFLIAPPVMPRGLVDFVDLVIPELQRRKLFRTEYQGETLRDLMGLTTPKSQFFC
jgi:N-acetyl-S-(2-succino)cysteine monooxygenase